MNAWEIKLEAFDKESWIKGDFLNNLNIRLFKPIILINIHQRLKSNFIML